MVKDKINYRARGPNTVLTRQPVQGRANDGGLRIGEMERDGVLAHGMSYFLNESFLVRGDEYYIAVCNKTGLIAIYNEAKNLFLSPSADGPIKFNTNPDGTMNIKNLSRFGRSFSILRVPYSLKLLIQELQVMNIQMRIITDENVDQLLSMSYSDNILKLLHRGDDTDLKRATLQVGFDIRDILYVEKKFNAPPVETPELPQQPPVPPVPGSSPAPGSPAPGSPAPGSPAPVSPAPVSPTYAPDLPTYNPESSPQEKVLAPPTYIPAPYNSDSPVYNPLSSAPVTGSSTPYASASPAYIATTPDIQTYNPGSPQYVPGKSSSTPTKDSILEVATPKEDEDKEKAESEKEGGSKKIIIMNEDATESSSNETKKITL